MLTGSFSSRPRPRAGIYPRWGPRPRISHRRFTQGRHLNIEQEGS
jgi:hypothetical protein